MSSYMSGLLEIARMMGRRRPKVTAKEKRLLNDRRPHVPPRSMTEEEKEYYKIHKKLP
jgi:hypothetical protein